MKSVFGESGGGRHLLDLGCGTGEHSRFFHSLGFAVTGVDRSRENIETARAGSSGPVFIEGDIRKLDDLGEAAFDGAVCVGNTLPHLLTEAELGAFAEGLVSSLKEGAALLLQILNYDRIHERKVRSLPLNVRASEGETIVFLRLMDPREDGTVLFNPCTLRYRPGEEPPVEVVTARNVVLRGWREREIVSIFGEKGLAVRSVLGGMQGQPFEPLESADLVILAVREGRSGGESGTTLGSGGMTG